MRSLLPAVALLVAMAAPAQTYSVVVADRVAGKLEVESVRRDVRCRYAYTDRGRGPEITARYSFGSDGIPTAIQVQGVDYLKAPVDERFSVENGWAHWKSASEGGESSTPGWYVTAAGPPVERAWLARAMLKSGKRALPLLPEGEATLAGGATHVTLTKGVSNFALTLYSISGLGFTPESVWLDESDQFFASLGEVTVIREGWEEKAPQLRGIESHAEDERYKELAVRLGHRPKAGLVIRHVRLFDSETATIRKNWAVAVSGNRITAAGPDGSLTAPVGAEVIDGAGKTLLPGLFDMHAHFEPFEGLLNIAAGVTSIRDLGNDMDELLHLKQQMDANQTIGPRVFLAGVIDGRGPYTAPTNVLADTEEEARAAIDRYAANGYFQIKIYSSVKPALVPFIVQTAHAKGMRVSGHVPAGMIASEFVDAGVDELQHINFLFLNFLPGDAAITNTRARLTLPAEHAAELDLNSAEVNAFVEKLKRKRIVVDPTLGAFEDEYTARPGIPGPSYAAIINWLPVQIRRSAYQGGLPASGGQDRRYRDSFQAMLNFTAKLYRAGIPLVIGTDGVAGLMLHRELELWVQAGIPPEKVLQIATMGAAQTARADRQLGSITPGKLADLVLVDGNPDRDISTVRRTRIVIKDGIVYRSSDLYGAVGIRQGG